MTGTDIIAPQAFGVQISLFSSASNRLDLLDFEISQFGSTPLSAFQDVAERPKDYVKLLKEDLRDGTLERLGVIGKRLADVLPEDAEALALYSIHLAITGQIVSARDYCNRAKRRSEDSPLVACAEAMVLREEGKLEAARAICERAITADPTHPYPWNILGHIHWRMGQTAEARASFQRAVEVNPRFLPGHSNAGAVAYALGDYAAALQAYQRALELNPANSGARYGLAVTLEALGDLEKAVEELKTAVQHNRHHAQANQKLADLQLRLGQLDDAFQTGQRMVEQRQSSGWLIMTDACLQKGEVPLATHYITNAPLLDANRHYLQGYCQLVEARYAEAANSMEQALKIEPLHFGAYVARAVLQFYNEMKIDPETGLTNHWDQELGPLLHYIRGSIRGANGDWPGALEAWRSAEDLVPGFRMDGLDVDTIADGSTAAHLRDVLLGILFYLKNLAVPALNTLERSFVVNPDSPLAHYWAGAASLKKGDRVKALHHFERASQEAPRFFAALYAAAELKFVAGNVHEAAELYRRAQAVKEDAGVALRLGVFYENTGEPKKAEREYRSVVRLAPNLYIGYNQLAWLLASRGQKLDEALELAKKANDLQPGNASILDTLGWIHYQNKNFDPALDCLKRAAQINRQHPVIQYHLGAVYYALNDTAAAKQSLQKSLELSDRSEVAAEVRQLLQTIP